VLNGFSLLLLRQTSSDSKQPVFSKGGVGWLAHELRPRVEGFQIFYEIKSVFGVEQHNPGLPDIDARAACEDLLPRTGSL
jgi:hypothetical protein